MNGFLGGGIHRQDNNYQHHLSLGFTAEPPFDPPDMQVRRQIAAIAKMPAKSVELLLTRGRNKDASVAYSGSEGGIEKRSAEKLDRDNSRRLGELDIR